MNQIIHAREFAIRIWPPEDRLIALISGNFDDSHSTGEVWTVAGYVGYANQWDFFEKLWTEALTRHGVPYFHMKEMMNPKKPFAKWLPPHEHVDEVAAFFKDLVAAIQKSGLYMVSSTVWLKDLERFNHETGAGLEPYPLAAHTCLGLIGEKYGSAPVMAIFDRVEKVKSKLATAMSYLNGSTFPYRGLCDHIAAVGSPAQAHNVPALQAADLIAWEVRKAHFGMREWQSAHGSGHSDRSAQWDHYVEFTRETTDEDPRLRKSLDALISGPLRSIVWDEMQLADVHKVRRGIWREAGE